MQKYILWKDIEDQLSEEWKKSKLPVVVGQSLEGDIIYRDLVKTGNILILEQQVQKNLYFCKLQSKVLLRKTNSKILRLFF
ncbi:hypothetical protein KBH77_02705 [Patescibacteria group bacterium]|nr:hypothetical protein [Patescibacteria group bacterium]